MKKTAIIGLGNLIKGNDGVGIQIIKEIKEEVPKQIEVIDGGTAGLNILNFMEKYQKIIIVDAINLGKEIGEVIELDANEITDNQELNISAHDIDFVDSLQISKELDINPEIKIIGIEIGEIRDNELTMELSDEVRKSIPEAKQKIMEEIKNTK